MTSQAIVRRHGNAYEIFIFVLTLLSLGVMVLLVLPVSPAVRDALTFYDNLICVVFLIDFAYNLSGSHPRREYLVRNRGWLDLLGSIPSFGVLPFTALFRLARLSRLARIIRAFRGKQQKDLVRDVIANRSQYALFITLLLVVVVLAVGSVLVLQFESASPDANITTGGDALWWAFVTLTTVGYGDRYPVTQRGRTTAVAVMFMGIGLIGALASLLASVLVTDDDEDDDETASTDISAALDAVRTELAATRAELSELRARLDR
jgi:voltage-gated potassium channel